MKKTVPFQKKITFDNEIFEINSIALEHQITSKENHEISGVFIISGDYKLIHSDSLNSFEYKLPFDISVDYKYDIDNADIDISDFYYEVLDNKVLSISIELTIDNIIEKEDFVEEVENKEIEETPLENDERCITQEVPSIFNNFSDSDDYVTYKIHIVTENDTIESILNDYMITKEQLSDYNDLSEIKVGDKLIISYNES